MQYRFLHFSRGPLAVAALAFSSMLGAICPAQAQSSVTLKGDESRIFSSGTLTAITTEDSSTATVAGATVDFFDSYDRSNAILTSGDVIFLDAYDNSNVDVLGGTIENSVLAEGNSFLTALGGTISNDGGATGDGTAVLAGGVYNSATSQGNGNVFLTGGHALAGAFAYDDSTMNVTGGTLGEMVSYGNSHIIVTGGNLGIVVETQDHSTIDLYGTHLKLSGGYIVGNLYETDPTTGQGYAVDAYYYNEGGTLTLHNSPPPLATLDTIYPFSSQKNDGENPSGGLAEGLDGNFYGTTNAGGKSGEGSVYVTSPSGAETTLYSFSGADGNNPVSPPTLGPDGNFYGTTIYGGAKDEGTVYQITPAGKLSTLYSFSSVDGAYPAAALTLGSDGNFYGTTAAGGSGTTFKITPKGKLTTLHFFNGTDGSEPYAPLTLGSDGNFYGTTVFGGLGFGNVFKMDATGSVSQVYAFSGGADGAFPYAGVVEGADGSFYGLTYKGGDNGTGEAYKVSTSGGFAPLYSFPALTSDNADGIYPFWALTLGADGNFYGTAYEGGANGAGTAFQLTSTGSETTLASFGGGDAGANPYGVLLAARNGGLYGTTSYGGDNNNGTLYKLSVRSLAPSAGYIVSVNLHPKVICGGNAKSYGVVTLTPAAPLGGAPILLTSSNPDIATVPSSVTVSPGGTTATFRVSTQTVTSSTPVTITATYGGASQTALLTLTPPQLEKVTLASNVAAGGAALDGNRVYLTGLATSDTHVELTSSNPAVALPKTEIIVSGANSHCFVLQTVIVTQPTLVTITATSGGVAKTATFTVLP